MGFVNFEFYWLMIWLGHFIANSGVSIFSSFLLASQIVQEKPLLTSCLKSEGLPVFWEHLAFNTHLVTKSP